MSVKQKTILVMAGGTGGHIFPALAIADELRKRQFQIVWLGSKKGMESRIIPQKNYPIEYIDIGGLRGKGIKTFFSMPYKLLKAILQTFSIFKKIQPDLAIGMGGFITGPGGLVSWLMRRPLIIHEQNAISGLSNNLLSLIASQCLTAFPGAFRGWFEQKNVLITGNPIRSDILNISRDSIDDKAKDTLNILVIGGSLGAEKINQTVPYAMQKLQQEGSNKDILEYRHYIVRHQCGKGKLQQVESIISDDFFDKDKDISISYQLDEFIDDMAQAYQWADLVICRSGALTVSEIAAVGITSILIPYPYAVDDHQTENARFLSDKQAGFLLSQDKLTAQSLKQIIAQCSTKKLSEMALNAQQLARPNATHDVAEQCLYWLDKAKKEHKQNGKAE